MNLPPLRRTPACALTSAPSKRSAAAITPIPVASIEHANRSVHLPDERLLSSREFAEVVKNAPLLAVDLLVQNQNAEVLLGLRRNPPARGCWFVPGGRLFKNEFISDAIVRIARTELGLRISDPRTATCIGVFEHFYDDNFSESPGFGTHYVVLACRLVADFETTAVLPRDQHEEYRWVSLDQLSCASDVHPYTRAYAAHL